MKKIFLSASVLLTLFFDQKANAQGMAVNTTGSTANSSAMLDVSSTTQGVLVPRMTSAQRLLISTPATGLLVYQTDGTAGFYFFNGSAWASLSGGGGSPTGSAGGDLSGTYPNPTLATSGVTSGSYGSSTQVPAYTVDSKGRITAAANITVTGVTPGGAAGGDLTGTYPNPTVANSSVTSSKILDGTITNSDISTSAAIAYSKLNLAGSVSTSDMNATGTASSGTFLRGDGTWAAPSGGSGTVTSVSSNNLTPLFTTSVSNATTTPTISYSLNNAPVFSVLTNNTGSINTPLFTKVHPNALLNLGGTANSTSFYRGDGQWVTPATGYTWTAGVNIANTATSYGPISSVGNIGNSVTFANKALCTVLASTSYTIDKFYVAGYVRGSGSVNTTCTGTIYVNDVASTCAVAFTINSAVTGTPASSTTNATSCNVSVAEGDRLYIIWTMDQPASGYQAAATISMHAQ